MWITGDVNLPQEILDAQSADRLVLFVGAGVSVGAPSNLPLFDKLARNLAELARRPFDPTVPLDFFLGSMPEDFDTHRHTRGLIARDDSKPNSTHKALVRVSSSVGQLRIVTTNFDDHLSSAASAEGIEVPDSWIGPALPLGGDFTGIVHIHGSVLQEPRRLVVTDKDFGRAYLTDAWATRFLLPMFQQFTVLFIGYSHDDPIMRYLALGLPSGTPRYAFTNLDGVNDSKWSRLGVRAIGYPVHGDDHSALVTALESWDLRARMGQTEHRARTMEIVGGGTALTPVEHDYLADQLATTAGAQEFVRAVAHVEAALQAKWLRWAEDLPEFKSIFAGHEGDAAAAVLGNWFCRSFISAPELHGAALQTVQRLGQAFGKSLFRNACSAADALSEVDADAGRRWKAFLATSVHGHSAPASTETLLPYLPGSRTEDLTVLQAALRSYLVLKRRWSFDDSEDLAAIPDAEVSWSADVDSLTGHVLRLVDVEAPGDFRLGMVLEDSLSAAYDLLDAYHEGRDWDSLAFGRAAIEPHEQDQFRDPIDAVIDGLRAYGEKALTTGSDLPERWWAIGRTLFRRLALHLLAIDATRNPDEKLNWLLDRALLYETDLKHETYRVLAVATEEASKETRDRLLEAVQTGPNFPEDISDHGRHTAYAIYNLLVWLAKVAPSWTEANAALAAAQNTNHDFAPRENPDFDKWMTSGTWGGKLPMEPEDFVRFFEEDPSGALNELLARDYTERNFDEPEWRDSLSLVSQVVESRPDLGEPLWALIEESTVFDPQGNDLRQAIIEGWARAPLTGIVDVVITRVAAQAENLKSARSVSRFLLEQVRKQVESDDSPALAAMRQIALNLWKEHAHSFTHGGDLDPNAMAPLYLNSWPGDLAQYWMVEIDRRWRKNRDDWSGLNDAETDALAQLLRGPEDALDATQPAVARHLFFLFSADSDFTTKMVLPLFLEDSTATSAWISYLHYSRYNDKLLAAGLLESTIREWNRLDSLAPHLRQQFFGFVLSIASFAGIASESRGALLDGSVLASDGKYTEEFASAVERFLRADEIDGAQVWDVWLREHLTARLNGIPRTSDIGELTRWADLVPYLGERIPEAISLLGGHGIGLGDQFVSTHFPQKLLITHGAILVTFFAERIRNSSPNYFIVQQVHELIDALRGVLGEKSVQPLEQAAIRFLGNSAL